MGVLRNAYWYGSQLTIEEARRHVPYANATSIQVVAGALTAIMWAIYNPRRSLLKPDDMDFEFCLERPLPWANGRRFTDWRPLQGRGELFEEMLDVDRPWQLENARAPMARSALQARGWPRLMPGRRQSPVRRHRSAANPF